MQLFLTIALCLMIGAATAYFANQRGRDPLIWFMIGMLLGIFGFLLLFLLPPVTEEGTVDEAEEVYEAKAEPTHRYATHEYLIKDWYYYDHDRTRQGPIRFEKLKDLWKDSEINEESFVWSEGMNDWQKIENVPSLYTHLQLG